jgi:hypothetical protein
MISLQFRLIVLIVCESLSLLNHIVDFIVSILVDSFLLKLGMQWHPHLSFSLSCSFLSFLILRVSFCICMLETLRTTQKKTT